MLKNNQNKSELHAYSNANSVVNKSILISGIARSGTTVLGKIFHSFDQVEYFIEPPLLLSLFAIIDNISENDWKLLYETSLYEDYLINALAGRNLNHNLNDDSCIFNVKEKTDVDLRKSISLRKVDAIESAKNKIIAYKIPNISNYFHKFSSYYPNTRIIIIRRNPIYVINSLVAKGWFTNDALQKDYANWPNYDFYENKIPFWVNHKDVELWVDMNEIDRCAYYYLEFIKHENNLKSKIIVSYEELIKSPRECVEKLANQLNLQFGSKTNSIINSIKHTERRRDLNIINKLSSNLRDEIMNLID